MRIVRLNDRAALLHNDGVVDIATASERRFSADVDDLLQQWHDFTAWHGTVAKELDVLVEPYDPAQLQAPILAPRQIFAVGLNYVDHAKESGVTVPTSPTIFTKFASCLAGPNDVVDLPSDKVDWELELVVTMSRHAYRVAEEKAWDYVAGLMVGQDLSERDVQLAGPVPQFSLGKSYPGFGPIGPALVTPDELDDPTDLAMTCTVDDLVVQEARSSEMVFGVSELISRISAICPLEPGDLIFTGTPPGVGMGRKPPVYLRPGQVLRSTISGLGELRNVMNGALGAELEAS